MEPELATHRVEIRSTELIIDSKPLARKVTCTMYLPDMDNVVGPLHLLVLNDGQDLVTMDYGQILQKLYSEQQIGPVLTVGITAGDRLQEFGVSEKPDYKGRGRKARKYRRFIIEELLPAISESTNVDSFASYTIAGFSLGALSAFDIAWHHSDIFSQVGAFSGSFWWRSKDLGQGYNPTHRLAHKMVVKSKEKPRLKFWFQVGTKDETADRDGNGIIDSIDDTTSLIAELYKKGYKRDSDVGYVELIGGRHDVPTWGRIMPKFLVWAFGTEK